MEYRNDFDLDYDVTYLNCAYMGPALKSSVEIGSQGVRSKLRPWQTDSQTFFSIVEDLRHAIAQILTTATDNIAIVPSASYGLATAAKFVEYEQGDECLLLSEQFPSNVYVWREYAKSHGLVLKHISRPDDHDWTQAIVAQMSSHTKVVSLPPCHWADGHLIDLITVRSAIDRICPSALFVVDGSQYVGGMNLDLDGIRPDVLVNVGYKWLLGPYGLGFMYVSPKHHDKSPLEYNWINRKNAEDFSGLVDYRDEYAEGARRFDMGEKSNFVLLPMFTESLKWIFQQGVATIGRHNRDLITQLEAKCDPEKVDFIPPLYRADHMTGVRLKKVDTAKMMATLRQKNIYVSLRGDAMRVSPYLYNHEEDISRLADVLNES